MPPEPQMLGGETDADSGEYAPDSAGTRSAILGYFLILFLAVGLGTPIGIAAIPISYYLKDNLRLSPVELAVFVVIAGIPAYFGFLPGFVRDRYRPRLMGDRFYLLVGATVALAAYLYLGIASITYSRLLYATLIAGIAYLIILSGSQALMTGVAQGHLMTGRLSVVSGVATYVPAVISALLGGWLVAHVPAHVTFLIAAVVTAVIAVQSFWRLDAVVAFEQSKVRSETSLDAIARLAGYRPIWPAAGIFLLWNFGPGWGTPMFYHLTETVKVSSQVFGTFTALQWLFFIPSAMLYAPLCRRFTLSSLLWWGTLVAILQGPIMFFARSPASALAIAVLYGLFGGLPTAAYVDLIIRSCPKGLEGTGMMLALTTTYSAATNSGNLLGSWIYARAGFTPAVIITTLATALIVPLLWWVPETIASAREGEALDFDSAYSDG
jgi:predicted MFS family arabinose efflux permease